MKSPMRLKHCRSNCQQAAGIMAVRVAIDTDRVAGDSIA